MLFGTNITSQSDELRKVTLEYLYHSLKNPKSTIEARIRQLRIVQRLNAKQYTELKRQLPYVVCGTFNPPYRRTENFAYTEYFIVDIDHITAKGLSLCDVRSQIEKDDRVVLSFVSPSQDGLKVLFKLKERCYDAGVYSLFYKKFVEEFSKKHNLEQVVDKRTCDVCRACFISVDNDAFYRKDCQLIDIHSYVNPDDSHELFSLKAKYDSQEVKNKALQKTEKTGIDEDTLKRVKSLLNPKAAKKEQQKQDAYVPEQLNEIIDDLKKYIEQTGVIVYEISNIQYAKKIKLKLNNDLAEINLFYGKRGFNVVQSPRCGTSSELNQLMADLIQSFLFDYY